MRAVAVGSIWLAATFLIAAFGSRLFPDIAGLWAALGHLAGLGSSISYYLGFATPSILRRAWQEPDLRAFLGRAASLPRLPTTEAIIREMERGAASSIGAPNASIGLYDEAAQVLRFDLGGKVVEFPIDNNSVSGEVFLTQRAMFDADVPRTHPMLADLSRERNAKALLVAPITAGKKRLGVLSVYAPARAYFRRRRPEPGAATG
jgi:hypothetical protein